VIESDDIRQDGVMYKYSLSSSSSSKYLQLLNKCFIQILKAITTLTQILYYLYNKS